MEEEPKSFQTMITNVLKISIANNDYECIKSAR